MNSRKEEKDRKDDLIGIRKARFASFVLLLICFASMLVIFVLSPTKELAYIPSAIVIVVLVALWWFTYRRILFAEAEFFEAIALDIRRIRIFESTVRQFSDGVVVVTDRGEIFYVNEAAKILLGAVDDDDMYGARYDEYAADFSSDLERTAILKAVREGKPPETIEVNDRTYKISYVAIRTKKDELIGAVAAISDVTEIKKVESMQIDFVANVSHELRTPLASVRSYAETLLTGAVDDAATEEEFLNIIISGADSMKRIIERQLFLARAEHIGIKIETAEVNLTELVRMSMKRLDMMAAKKSITINRLFSDVHVPVEIDRVGVEQVMQNILSNAIKYTEKKGRIDVDIIQAPNCVQIVISDNGLGIPEEDLPRVFEPYYTVEKSRSTSREATGLGLAISKGIVEAHGGSINIESKYGRGTIVTVSLTASKIRGTPGIE